MKAQLALWLGILNSFRSLFSSPSFLLFCSLVPAWCLCTTRHTISGIYRIAAPLSPRAHDSFHRFFRCACWSLEKLWAMLASSLIERFCPTGPVPVLLDDTAFHKTGRKIVGAGWWRDAFLITGGPRWAVTVVGPGSEQGDAARGKHRSSGLSSCTRNTCVDHPFTTLPRPPRAHP